MTCLNMALGSFGNYYISLCFSTLVHCDTLHKNTVGCIPSGSLMELIPSNANPVKMETRQRGRIIYVGIQPCQEINRNRERQIIPEGTGTIAVMIGLFIRYRIGNLLGSLITVVTQ